VSSFRAELVPSPGERPLPLPHDLRRESGLDVAGNLDLDRTDLGQHRLGPHPVARVAEVAADRIMLVIGPGIIMSPTGSGARCRR
jgi:hypothetical protein